MKSISLLASLAALSAICLSFSCSSKSDGTDAAAGDGAGGNSSNAGSSGKGGNTSKAGNGAGGDAGEGDITNAGAAGDDSSAGGAGGDSSGAGSLTACSSGELFEGDPLYNDKAEVAGPKPAGQALLADPPIRSEAMAIIGNRLFIETEQEIWSTVIDDPAAKLTRIAGTEVDSGGFVSAGVACKDTQFLVIRDMTATADGKLVVVDYVGGAVIEITNPGLATCKSTWVAGTHVKTADPVQEYPLAQGDQDGPGADALFGDVGGGGGIHKVAVDPDGNIYTYDDGTGKFKMIATDADRTVSTIGVIASKDDNVMGLAFLNGKLYATGVDGSNDFLQEIDPAKYKVATPKANVKDIFRNRDQFPEVAGSGHQAILSQIYVDGDAFVVAGQYGYVWRLGTDGTVLATLAGSGPYLEYVDSFDPTVAHPAADWQLVNKLSNADGGPWLALSPGKLFWTGGIGIGKYTVQFSCP